MASSLHSNLSFVPKFPNPKSFSATGSYVPVRCGPRSNRGPLVKGRVLSTEAIHAIQALKRAHRGNTGGVGGDDAAKVRHIFTRLLKADLQAALNELLRQDQCALALHVFAAIRSEPWYATDLGLYATLLSALARQGLWEDIDRVICDLEGEAPIPCDEKGVTKLLKALMVTGKNEWTVRIYGVMKKSGWGSTWVGDEYVTKVLSRGLRRVGERALAHEVEMEYERFCKVNLEKSRI